MKLGGGVNKIILLTIFSLLLFLPVSVLAQHSMVSIEIIDENQLYVKEKYQSSEEIIGVIPRRFCYSDKFSNVKVSSPQIGVKTSFSVGPEGIRVIVDKGDWDYYDLDVSYDCSNGITTVKNSYTWNIVLEIQEKIRHISFDIPNYMTPVDISDNCYVSSNIVLGVFLSCDTFEKNTISFSLENTDLKKQLQELSQKKASASDTIEATKKEANSVKTYIQNLERYSLISIIVFDKQTSEIWSKYNQGTDYLSQAETEFNSGNYDNVASKITLAKDYLSQAKSDVSLIDQTYASRITILKHIGIVFGGIIIIVFAIFLIKKIRKKKMFKHRKKIEKIKHCPKCGEKIEEDDVYCMNCGKKLRK